MNRNIKNSLFFGIIAAAGAAAMISCTDNWNDHYDTPATLSFSGTTMQKIEADAPDFASVIKAVGYDQELSSDVMYTIFVPQNFNKSDYINSDGTLAQDSAYILKSFIKNHIARSTYSVGGDSLGIVMLNEKISSLSPNGTLGSVKIKDSNITCTNGIVHMLDGVNPYSANLFEKMEQWYNVSTTAGKDDRKGGSLYAYLTKSYNNRGLIANEDSLDESRSISRGLDIEGNKIWVNKVVLRNNTLLNNVDAPIYREDSSFIALIPSEAAWQKRYGEYKALLNFNPNVNVGNDTTMLDSIRNHYANLFAMTDLFYNNNVNLHQQDSLNSTLYSTRTPYYNVYYRHTKLQHPDRRPVNDILAGLTPEACSNGTAYYCTEYPMSIYEQAFRRIDVMASSFSQDNTVDTNNKQVYNQNLADDLKSYNLKISFNEKVTDSIGNEEIKEVSDSTYYFYDVKPTGEKSVPTVTFKIPNTLSGTYDIYVVMHPVWFMDAINNNTSSERMETKNKFEARIYERNGDPTSKTALGAYPGNGKPKALVNPLDVDGKAIFETNPENYTDVIYLGEYTFANAYYNRNDEGVMIQLKSKASSKEVGDKSYSHEFLIQRFILKPKATAEN